MEINDIVKEKEELARQITKLLNDFEIKTKLCVDDIYLERGFMGSGGMMVDNRFPLYVTLKVRI